MRDVGFHSDMSLNRNYWPQRRAIQSIEPTPRKRFYESLYKLTYSHSRYARSLEKLTSKANA